MKRKPDYDRIQQLELEIFGQVKTELPLPKSITNDPRIVIGAAGWLRGIHKLLADTTTTGTIETADDIEKEYPTPPHWCVNASLHPDMQHPHWVEGDSGLAWWLKREDTYEMESTEYRWQYGYAALPILTKSIEKEHTRWHLIRSYGLRVSITLIGVLLMFVVIYIALLMEKGL